MQVDKKFDNDMSDANSIDFDSPDEVEFRRKLANPFHLFQKDDVWATSSIFCLSCGKESHPLIKEKLILNTHEKSILKEFKVIVGDKVQKYPGKELKYKQFTYLDVFQCRNDECKEIYFRTFVIREDLFIPNEEPKLFPARKDKMPIKKSIQDTAFEKIYSRYLEAVMAYNNGLFYGAGASIRSVLEILCKVRGHFDAALNDEINGRALTIEQLASLKRRIGLEKQMEFLLPEIQKIAKRKFGKKLLGNIKAMMYWGHGVVHGSTEPSESEVKSGLEVLEEFFMILYLDSIDVEKKRTRMEKFTLNTEQFKGHRRR